ncbi:Imm52 family immunity protein [Cupriavidus alkaliphilus]|uniref:Imm52 family immunity protein n=1 Tax=Cupriavidus alkaliphilus TaxID=942866 RepID=UPI0008154E17|nr:Imm52 family immunity protein [Cupriavidus alkaliphilus]SCB07141.1 Immunity protein 52 [Cupriavidus alkaliphilus]
MSHELCLWFRHSSDSHLTLRDHLSLVQKLTGFLGAEDTLLDESAWLLAGDTKDDSYRYLVFDSQGPTTTALSVLNQELEAEDVIKTFVIWNGQLANSQGASISYYFDRADGAASAMSLTLGSKPPSSRLGPWTTVAKVLSEAVKIWDPLIATVETRKYDGVFPDRPGVGWMIYLPTIVTEQHVPEARALMAVSDGCNDQMGTIVVSVTDGPFSGTDPEHVRSANAIEIRLAELDLLPRFIDL